MDPNVIVEVKDVSMRFNQSSERFDNLKEYFIKTLKRQVSFQEFWALKGVSLEVHKEESVGLVGLNGSGKSTLLKIIAGVLKPTKGTLTRIGSIAPLIELGAGFDIDLTARENVYLNGALLGYNREQMTDWMEDIIEFSELRDFMDLPIKNFSSGMISRLAFSIATIGIPDILIVDEVLSVGDFRFQQKCQERIQNMKEQGTTILFVSHNSQQVEEICDKALWLEKGVVRDYGPASEICPKYRNAY